MGKKFSNICGRLLCLILTGCMLVSSCAVLAASKETQDKIDQVEKEKNEAEQEKAEQEKEKRDGHGFQYCAV